MIEVLVEKLIFQCAIDKNASVHFHNELKRIITYAEDNPIQENVYKCYLGVNTLWTVQLIQHKTGRYRKLWIKPSLQ